MNYPDFVATHAKPLSTYRDRMDHAFIGMLGELGELADAWKKHTLYEQPLDMKNILEELGDFRFYLQVGLTELNQIFKSVDPKDLSIDFSGWDNVKLFLRTAAALSLTHQTVDEKSSRDEIRCKLYNIGIHYEEMCRRFNVTDGQVIEANMTKLMKRYPNGYTNEHARLRLDKQDLS
jgi:hypothetical protein